MLASEYGWAKKEILTECYFDEYLFLRTIIDERKTNETLLQIAVIHGDPQRMSAVIQGEELPNTPEPALPEPSYIEHTELDKSAFDRLRTAMQGNPRIVVK